MSILNVMNLGGSGSYFVEIYGRSVCHSNLLKFFRPIIKGKGFKFHV